MVWPQVVQGIGVACFFMPLTTITLSGLRPDQIAGASSLSNFMRILAGSIGASFTTTLWDRREAVHHATPPGQPRLGSGRLRGRCCRALGSPDAQQAGLTAGQITRQAYIMASNEIFWASGWLFIALIALVWMARPFRPGEAARPWTAACIGRKRQPALKAGCR